MNEKAQENSVHILQKYDRHIDSFMTIYYNMYV